MSAVSPVLSSSNVCSKVSSRNRECDSRKCGVRLFSGQRALEKTNQVFHAYQDAKLCRSSHLRRAASSESEGRADSDARSYLSMWKKAKERFEKEQLQKHASTVSDQAQNQSATDKDIQVQREKEFARILEVPQEERDRVHRLQVIDRAAAALAAAEALLANRPRTPTTSNEKKWEEAVSRGWGSTKKLGDSTRRSVVASAEPATTIVHTPGPDFWTWSPPEDSDAQPQPIKAQSDAESKPGGSAVLEREKEMHALEIPFETASEDKRSVLPLVFQSRAAPSIPPLQSIVEIKDVQVAPTKPPATEIPAAVPERDKLADAVVHEDLQNNKTKFSTGVNPDGSRWWKETGEEDRGNGVICNWSVTRGVSSEGVVEWEEKFWEACDDFDYKELGSEKSGRDSSGNVWREFWKEAIWQDAKSGLLHMEKSAEKWGKNGKGCQWSEKWFEHYDASGRADKWADKWSVIDPNTPLDPGHGHVWHERWGEEFDGKGGAMKYTDKWAERAEFGGWTKWGDKWDERFDKHEIGKKQGETWWVGANGERWNRTWGEQHNGTGWVHKYGASSSGEHWDTHEQQETWYEKFPHYGFHHCMENSQQLQKVSKKKKRKL